LTKNPNIYITAILPAHNEHVGIQNAVYSIREHVDKIIVACDNCNDDTFIKAKDAGADIVFNTVNNDKRKAGAINQAMDKYVDWTISNQYCLIMDADTQVLNPAGWFKKASSLVYPNRPRISHEAAEMSWAKRTWLRTFHWHTYNELFVGKAYDCIGSIFQSKKKLHENNIIEMGQRLEWESYASKIERSQKVFVLTGTCSLISCDILQKVHRLNFNQYYYDEESLTEDFAMTISVKEVGARLISPTDCVCYTETKGTIKELLAQRRRWYMGAIVLVSTHRIDKVTLPYIWQQIMLFISVIAYMLFLGISTFLYVTRNVDFTLFWFVVFIGFTINQVAKVWKYGNWFDRMYAASMIGCLYYSALLQIAYLWALQSYLDNYIIYWNESSKDGRKE
jgi:poly-beta-1,6-N-acetyl-D-glucosamine synthase